jgi:hypothetical protein
MTAKTLQGNVLSTEGPPISGAKVQIKGKTVTVTDRSGFYEIDRSKFKEKTGVTFIADGHMSNTRILRPGSKAILPVLLAPIANRASFSAEAGGALEFKGAVMNVPPSAFVDGRGKTVKGKVNIEFTLLDVTDRIELAAAMGEFTGRMLDRKVEPLQSYGVFEWKAFNEKQQPLMVAPKTRIGLSIAIPRSLINGAPRRAGIFTIDRNQGIWIQEGWFELEPETLTYNGTITVATGMNIDVVGPGTCITIEVLNAYDNSPEPGFMVWAQGDSYTSSGITNSSGKVCLIVKQGDTIDITAYGSNWGTPQPVIITAPTTNSTSADCGDPLLCPTTQVCVDFITGLGVFKAIEKNKAGKLLGINTATHRVI